MSSSDATTSKRFRPGGCDISCSPVNHSAPRRRYRALLLLFVLALLRVGTTMAQSQPADESAGKSSGNYHIQQTAEFGYRDSLINGNLNNYNTFEDLNTGVRLFDYTVDMRSINHQGILFDNLSFSNFGYGGDPNDVSRLRVSKNK